LVYETTETIFSGTGEITTDPTFTDFHPASDMNNVPRPSHLIQIKGQTFGLVPNSGLYKFNRSLTSGSWQILTGNPYGSDFVSMTKYKNGLALLQRTGAIVFYDPDDISGSWNPLAPYISETIKSMLPLAISRPTTFVEG
jgi:hypothetical protein